MGRIPTLPGITERQIATARISTHVLSSGLDHATPVLFVHGNASSATFWEETMLRLPPDYRGIAPDLRGYGETEDKLIDATRGMGDWVDDLLALADALDLDLFHLVGHSLGGSIALALIARASERRVLTATLVAPGSPYGFSGCKGLDGEPCYADFAGSGGGIVNAEFATRMAAQDRSSEGLTAPRFVMNSFYWKPPFHAKREEELLSSMLSERVGPRAYPGDLVPSANWPNVAPGVFGPANALSPKYVGDTVKRFVSLPRERKPNVRWIRGADDQIVADASLFDLGTLGKMGVVPGWPGEDVFPPQPMVSQMRAVLRRYDPEGALSREVVLKDCGHTPYIEKPKEFDRELHAQLRVAVASRVASA
ncbi:MAG TPA: alpha/beta hydrolase [Candidatus Limnocylindria bacterium]|nr:alpha/beta hydrolase [Candidatus Limnocylindria bacterium]